MIKLKLKILSFYYTITDFRKEYKEYNIVEEYDDNMTFDEVIKNLHSKYKIDNGESESYFIPHITELMWKQYFSEELCRHIDATDEDYLKLKLSELEKQFNISQFEIPIYLNYDAVGQAIAKIEGISFSFHFNEKDRHHNPHIHCEYSGEKTRIEIDTLKVLDKPFKRSKMDVAINFIKNNKEELHDYWDKAIIDGQPIELNIRI